MRGQTFIVAVPAKIVHTITASLIVGVIVATAILTRPADAVTVKPPETTVKTSAGGCYGSGYAPYGLPPGCIFGLSGMRFLVSSQFAYEAGLVPGVISDTDYGLGYGVQEVVRLPGPRSARYVYRGSAYVPGSGTALLFSAPNGGAFAFFHIAVSYLAVAALPLIRTALTAPVNRRLSGDEATVLAIEAMPRTGVAVSSTLRGGTKVGLSGWPSSLEYSNGSCYDATSCASDSHLCVSSSGLARQWFWQVANGQVPKPKKPNRKPFPVKAWGPLKHSDRHGHLIWPASVWVHHMTLGRYLDHARYFKPKHGTPYMVYRFQRGRMTCWPKRHTCKVTR